MAETLVDLRDEPRTRLQSTLLYEVRDLSRGEAVVLLTAEDPALALDSVNLHLRQRLRWQIDRPEPGTWRAWVSLRDEAQPAGIVDGLTRHHQSLDELLARILQMVNAGEAERAAPMLGAFADAIRRHIELEDRVLAAGLGSAATAAPSHPVQHMLREHREILDQLALAEGCIGGSLSDSAEAGIYLAILSGTLAKHEHREESSVFPIWDAALAQLAAHERERLEERVRELLRLPLP